jgi:hypothetical protein
MQALQAAVAMTGLREFHGAAVGHSSDGGDALHGAGARQQQRRTHEAGAVDPGLEGLPREIDLRSITVPLLCEDTTCDISGVLYHSRLDSKGSWNSSPLMLKFFVPVPWLRDVMAVRQGIHVDVLYSDGTRPQTFHHDPLHPHGGQFIPVPPPTAGPIHMDVPNQALFVGVSRQKLPLSSNHRDAMFRLCVSLCGHIIITSPFRVLAKQSKPKPGGGARTPRAVKRSAPPPPASDHRDAMLNTFAKHIQALASTPAAKKATGAIASWGTPRATESPGAATVTSRTGSSWRTSESGSVVSTTMAPAAELTTQTTPSISSSVSCTSTRSASAGLPPAPCPGTTLLVGAPSEAHGAVCTRQHAKSAASVPDSLQASQPGRPVSVGSPRKKPEDHGEPASGGVHQSDEGGVSAPLAKRRPPPLSGIALSS